MTPEVESGLHMTMISLLTRPADAIFVFQSFLLSYYCFDYLDWVMLRRDDISLDDCDGESVLGGSSASRSWRWPVGGRCCVVDGGSSWGVRRLWLLWSSSALDLSCTILCCVSSFVFGKNKQDDGQLDTNRI